MIVQQMIHMTVAFRTFWCRCMALMHRMGDMR